MGRAILASAAISGLVLPIQRRRRDRDGRRLGAELPVRARVSESRRSTRSQRSATSRATGQRRRVPRTNARAARALPRGASRACAARRGPPRAGAGVARRAGALRGAHRSSHACRVRPQRRRRGAARKRARDIGRRSSVAPGGRDGGGCRGGGAMAPPAAARRARSPLRVGALPVPSRPARPRADRARDSGRGRPRPDVPEASPWPVERKRALIERGYALTDEALARSDLDDAD